MDLGSDDFDKTKKQEKCIIQSFFYVFLQLKSMKKSRPSLIILLLVIEVATYFGVIANGTTRAVEFLAILVMGVLLGILIAQLMCKKNRF